MAQTLVPYINAQTFIVVRISTSFRSHLISSRRIDPNREHPDLSDPGGMSTLVILPEKRNDLGHSEAPPEKRAKLEVDDTAMESQINSNAEESKSAKEEATKSGEGSTASTCPRVIPDFCEVCYANVGHTMWDCPDRSTGMGFACPSCCGPCKVKDGDPNDHWEIETVKRCVQCGSVADHWVDDCPYWTQQPSDSDDDSVPF